MFDVLGNLERAHSFPTNDDRADFIARVLAGVFAGVQNNYFKRQVQEGLKELAPKISELLKNKRRVMIHVAYDLRDDTPELELLIPAFVGMAIVGAGNDRWKVINDLKQPAFAAPNGPALEHPKGCDFDAIGCSKEHLYIWYTRFFVEYLTIK